MRELIEDLWPVLANKLPFLSRFRIANRVPLLLSVCPRFQRGVVVKSSVVKRSIVLAGHKTSVSLEDAFWMGLKEIAGRRRMTLRDLVGTIDSQCQ
jgi:Ribbon-helix-helix domain